MEVADDEDTAVLNGARNEKGTPAHEKKNDLPPQNNVVAKPKKPRGGKSPRVVANPEVARGGKSSSVVVVDDDEDEDDQIVSTRPRKDARIEIASRKRDKGTVYVLRWRWQMKDKDGEPLRTASGGYKRGSLYVKSITDQTEAKRLRRFIKRSR